MKLLLRRRGIGLVVGRTVVEGLDLIQGDLDTPLGEDRELGIEVCECLVIATQQSQGLGTHHQRLIRSEDSVLRVRDPDTRLTVDVLRGIGELMQGVLRDTRVIHHDVVHLLTTSSPRARSL